LHNRRPRCSPLKIKGARHIHTTLKRSKSARSAGAFLKEVIAKAPYRLHPLLTDNDKVNSQQRRKGALGYKVFTDRATVAKGPARPTGITGSISSSLNRASIIACTHPQTTNQRHGGAVH